MRSRSRGRGMLDRMADSSADRLRQAALGVFGQHEAHDLARRVAQGGFDGVQAEQPQRATSSVAVTLLADAGRGRRRGLRDAAAPEMRRRFWGRLGQPRLARSGPCRWLTVSAAFDFLVRRARKEARTMPLFRLTGKAPANIRRALRPCLSSAGSLSFDAARATRARLCGRTRGEVPEWLKGTDCKSVGFAYAGSNPAPSTISCFPCSSNLCRLGWPALPPRRQRMRGKKCGMPIS